MKETQTHRCEQRAFTRLELMAVLFALAFLATIALPMLASSRGRAEQASCFNNLRQIGRAFQLWASDHGDRNPWATPVREGGTFGSTNPYKAEAYFQMGMISNELATPRILVCPSDIGVGGPRRMASDFSFTNLNGGFFVVGFRSAALSYTIGLHSFPGALRAVLSGDRNIRWDAVNVSCSYGVAASGALFDPRSLVSHAVWTNAIHGEQGNLLFNDGGVEQVSNAGLRRASRSAQDNIAIAHFLVPN